jgi:hypothetical protein
MRKLSQADLATLVANAGDVLVKRIHLNDLCNTPEIRQLLLDAAGESPTTQEFIVSFKPRIQKLVGWAAKNPALRTSEAYDYVYDMVYAEVVDP